VLLDEPLSALDTPTRRRLRGELRRLQTEMGLATVVVTHDPEEAAVLADEIVVLEGGRVLQAGRTRDLFDAPGSVTVARLLDVPNVHSGRAASPGAVIAGGGLHLDAKWISSPVAVAPGTGVLWNVEPEAVIPRPGAAVRARVMDVVDHGRFVEATLQLPGGVTLASRHPDAAGLAVGALTGVELPPARTWILPDSGETAAGRAGDGTGQDGDHLVGLSQVGEDDVSAEAAQLVDGEPACGHEEAVSTGG
jgi:ABC-type Fe3+/spermidine/putrescine transport system ATPase subunit